MVDLKAKPFNLSDSDIKWVMDTIESMTIEEKIGQLFVNMGSQRTKEYLKGVLDTYHIGAVRYNPGKAEEVWEQNYILQTESKIPLLIAANTERGGDGACTDGTEVGYQVKVAATNDTKYAYEMGRVAGIEASAIGCNWSFAPIVDLSINWRNAIISSRAFSSDADKVLANSLAYMKGIQESGIAPAAKHFPGDGIDERDQHLSFSVNSLSCEDWDKTFGKVYKGLIDAGLPSIMAGHIHMPAYSKKYNPEGGIGLPATLSKELITDLLRGELGFNGVVVTDASHMVAMTSAMKRSEMLPTSIAAGCDLFLFFNDPDEDFGYMMEGYKKGIITEERLQDALMRILGLKAMIGLNKKAGKDLLLPKEEAMKKIGLSENRAIFDEVADKAITLVKNKQPEVFPVTKERYKKILLTDVVGVKGGFGEMLGRGGKETPTQKMKKILEERGFDVEIYKSPLADIMELPPEQRGAKIANVYSLKAPIKGLTDKYDLVIFMANVNPGTVQRIVWEASKGTPDVPFFVHELPVIFVSVQCPFHLADVPQVKTYINAYDQDVRTLNILADKLMGKSEFKGVSPVDAYCGFDDTFI